MSNKQQSIVDAIETRLKTITKAAGYSTDLKNVFVNRDDNVPVRRDDTPCITFKDPSATTLKLEYPKRDHSLTVFIVGWLSSNSAASQARDLANDIHKAFGTDDTFGGLALYSVPGDRNLEKDTDGDVSAAIKIIMTVNYRTNLWEI